METTKTAKKENRSWMIAFLAIVSGLVACAVVLWGGVILIENYRGKKSFEKWKTAHPDFSLNYTTYIPSEIPDDQNFALCGCFKKIISLYKNNDIPTESNEDSLLIYNITGKIKFLKSREGSMNLIDISKTANNFRLDTNNFPGFPSGSSDAEIILMAVKKSDKIFDELRDCVKSRQHARFPVDYPDVSPRLPHLTLIKQLTSILHLRIVAFLETGRVNEAFEDARLAYSIINYLKEDVFMISQLVRCSALSTFYSIVEEGVYRGSWKSNHLTEFILMLNNQNLLSDFVKRIPCETAFLINMIEKARVTNPEIIQMMFSSGSHGDKTICCPASAGDFKMLLKLIPGGWFYQNYVSLCQYNYYIMTEGLDINKNRIYPSKIKKKTEEIDFEKTTIYNTLARVEMIETAVARVAFCDSIRNCLKLVCAIEKYRFKNGKIPEKLDDLVPEYIPAIPLDIIDGKSLRYKPERDNSYTVYSIGWDEKDNGGMPCSVIKEKDVDWTVEIKRF